MAERTPIRLAILNDFSLVVRGLAGMLAPYAERVSIEDVSIRAGSNTAIDVALYDTFGTSASDLHYAQFVSNGWVPRHVVLYSWEGTDKPPSGVASERPVVVRVSKTLEGEALVQAVEQIHRTGSYEAARSIEEQLLATVRRWPGKEQGLTERESEVVVMIVQGLSNQELAERLFLSINTVKTYIRSAYRTMGVTSRSNAVLWGIDHGCRLETASR